MRLTDADVRVISDPLAEDILAHQEHGERAGCWKAPK